MAPPTADTNESTYGLSSSAHEYNNNEEDGGGGGDGDGVVNGSDSFSNIQFDATAGIAAPPMITPPSGYAANRRKVGLRTSVIDRVSIFEKGSGPGLGIGGSDHNPNQFQPHSPSGNLNQGLDALLTPRVGRKRGARPSLAGRISTFESPATGSKGSVSALLTPLQVKQMLNSNRKNRESIIKIVDNFEELNHEQRRRNSRAALKQRNAKRERLRLATATKNKNRTSQSKIAVHKRGSGGGGSGRTSNRRSSLEYLPRRSAATTTTKDDGKVVGKPILDPVWNEVRANKMDFSQFQVPKYELKKTSTQEELIKATVQTNFVFDEFGIRGDMYQTGTTDELDRALQAIDTLVQSFEPMEYKIGDYIVHQERGDAKVSSTSKEEEDEEEKQHFYIVEQGRVAFQVDGVTIGHAEEGDCFGEPALLYNSTPTASAVSCVVDTTNDTTTSTKVLRLDQKTFRGILHSHTTTAEDEKRKLLLEIDFLKDLLVEEPQLIQRLTSIMMKEDFMDGQSFSATPNQTFYMIQDGILGIDNYNLGKGDYLGEDALMKGSSTEEDSSTTPPVSKTMIGQRNGGTFYTIDRITMEKVLGPDRLRKLRDKLQLNQMPFFQAAQLNDTAMDALMDRIVEKSFDDGQDVIQDLDTEKPSMYFVRQGTVEVSNKDEPESKKVISAGEVFGNNDDDDKDNKDDDHIPARRRRAGFTATATGGQPVICGVLDLDDVDQVKDIPEEKDDDGYLPDDSPFLKRRADLRVSVKSNIKLEDLERISLLGEGQFGEVWLVAADVFGTGIDELKQKFALKSQYKTDDIRLDDATDAIRREIEMIETIQHPGILDLVNTYEDDASIYMLMGLIPGGELWDVLHKEDEAGNWSSGVSEEDAKFYTLVVADTLAYMHSQKYVFRDLKPENIMIDAEGYPVIIDFGFAKYCEDKTYTFCGTPNYVAPEIVKNSGHNAGVDHWALGCVVYEMLTGENPFYYDGMDQVALFEAICYEKYYPFANPPSDVVIELVDGLLEKDPAQRLGMLAGGSKDIINHKWFEGIDLQKLRNKEIRAPWIPEGEDEDLPDNNMEQALDLDEIMELAEEEDEEEAAAEQTEGLMGLPPPMLDTIGDSMHEMTVHEEEDEDDSENEEDSKKPAVKLPPPPPMESPADATPSAPTTPVPLVSPTSATTSKKKKVSLSPKFAKGGYKSPYADRKKVTKEEKVKSSKERRATISGALLATLDGFDDSADLDFDLGK